MTNDKFMLSDVSNDEYMDFMTKLCCWIASVKNTFDEISIVVLFYQSVIYCLMRVVIAKACTYAKLK